VGSKEVLEDMGEHFTGSIPLSVTRSIPSSSNETITTENIPEKDSFPGCLIVDFRGEAMVEKHSGITSRQCISRLLSLLRP
jgi:hypothetical protein